VQLQSGAIKCYVCKRSFEEVHHFYDAMCAQCGELNHRKRTQKADMKGAKLASDFALSCPC
jgi:pentatricopeptide repeat protein